MVISEEDDFTRILRFPFQSELLVIVMVIVPILLFLSLTGQPASAALPAGFLSLLVRKRIVPETHEIVDATDLLRALLPAAAFSLLCGDVPDFLDRAKWNRLPTLLNPTDAFLRMAVFGGATKDFRWVLLGSIMARRFLNESYHLLLVLDAYGWYSVYPHKTIDAYVTHLENDDFRHYYGDILGIMLDDLDSAILQRAVSDACAIMGVQPRTGYLCPSLTKGLDRIEGFVTYIEKEVIPWIKSLTSAREGMALLPRVCGKADGFHLYQVELTFQPWSRHTKGSYHLRDVAGPGMLPLACSMAGHGEYDFKGMEAESDHEGEGKPIKKRSSSFTSSLKKGTWKEYRLSVCICHFLVELFLKNDLLLAVCEYMNYDKGNVDYDFVEHVLCEIRRWLAKRRLRKQKTGKDGSRDVLYAKMRAYMSCMCALVRQDCTGGNTAGRKAGVAERLERELKRRREQQA